MKAFIAPLAVLAFVSSPTANATNASDLSLECSGTYFVNSSSPYYFSHEGTRSLPEAGTSESITVLSQHGNDCEKLEDFYGITVKVGESLSYGTTTVPTLAAAQAAAKARWGQVFTYSVSQIFSFMDIDGTLPLFPTLHQETAQLLSKSGVADANALYGTVAPDELSEGQWLQVMQVLMTEMKQGQVFETWYYPKYIEQLLALFLELEPSAGCLLQHQYFDSLMKLFKGAAKKKTSFVTLDSGVYLGHKVIKFLNAGFWDGGDTLTTWQENPMLFDAQIVSWGQILTDRHVPEVNPSQITAILEYAYEVTTDDLPAPGEHGYYLELHQYQTQVASLIKYYDLDPSQLALANSILEL